MAEKYLFDLSARQLKASSSTSALLAGFAVVSLVELKYETNTPRWLLIALGVVTAFLVSVHLLALMMSTCIEPHMKAAQDTDDSPHIRMKFYIDLSWIFSTCVGLILFLIEIGLVFYEKFRAIRYVKAGYVTTGILVPVLFIFIIISCLIHKNRAAHADERIDRKVSNLRHIISTSEQNLSLIKVV